MRGIRLSSLSVGAFRGISEPITFDLSSPLTLVFAPNGTGKTTMCEAAEWLLTGQVERLKDRKDFDANVLRSKFVDTDQSPNVEASFTVGSEPKFLCRTTDGSSSPATFGPTRDQATRVKPHDLLSVLAPAAAADEAHHLTAISLRQRWLKGTRFLSAEALAALVDTDEETIERRKQVFADLLGIRHLLDAERQCERYVSDLSTTLRALTQDVDRRKAEAQELEKALATDADTNVKTSAQEELSAAENILELASLSADFNADDLPARLEAATAVCKRRSHILSEHLDSLNKVESQWATRQSLVRSVNEGKELEASLAKKLTDIETLGRNAASRLAEEASRRDIANDTVRALSGGRDRLNTLATALLAALRGAQGSPPDHQTLQSLSDELGESGWTLLARRQRRQELAALKTSIQQSAEDDERLRLVQDEISNLTGSVASETSIAQMRAAVAEADLRARTANSVFDATAEPVARLHAAATELLQHDHRDLTHCPVCSHDWKSALSLQKAIADTLAAAPSLLSSSRAALEAAQQAARAAQTALDTTLSTRANLINLEKEQGRLLALAGQRNRDSERLGITSKGSLVDIEVAIKRLDIADALAALLSAAAEVTATLPNAEREILSGKTAIKNLLDEIISEISSREQEVQLKLAEMALNIDAATAQRDDLRTQHAGIVQQLRDCRANLEARSSELTVLRDNWKRLAADSDWTDETLAELKQEALDASDGLRKAEAHLDAASAAWDAELRRGRLSVLRSSLEPSQARQGFMEKRIAAAKRAQAVFQKAYITTSHQQVNDLSRVVNPLFARMHANRVFDNIKLGEANNFLHWLADAGDVQLDPGKDFSQGQRQDLALALFVARARSLGGTFFLDEPVIHLDDLNRVGLLDILRATVLEGSRNLNFVITTSSRSLARHLIEKFAAISPAETSAGPVPPLKVIELDGNGRSGVQLKHVYPLP